MSQPFAIQRIIGKFDDAGKPSLVVQDYSETTGQLIRQWSPPTGFKLPLLLNEMDRNGCFVKQTYRIPEEDSYRFAETMAAIRASLTRLGVTIGYMSGTSARFTAISFRDVNGTPREWGDFRTFELREGPKPDKRLSSLGTWVYMSGIHGVRIVEDPTMHYPSIPGVITILVLDDPEDPVFIDGNIFVRDSVRNEFVKAMESQIDDVRRDRVVKAHTKTDCFNFRGITPIGMLKGDIVACRAQLPADIVVHRSNIAPELATSENKIISAWTPQGQMKSVRADRQSVAHFYDALYAIDTPEGS